MGFFDSFFDSFAISAFLMVIVGAIIGILENQGSKSKDKPKTMNEKKQSNTFYEPVKKVPSGVNEREPFDTIMQQTTLQTIEKLAALKDKGILTAEEFEKKKTELLKNI